MKVLWKFAKALKPVPRDKTHGEATQHCATRNTQGSFGVGQWVLVQTMQCRDLTTWILDAPIILQLSLPQSAAEKP